MMNVLIGISFVLKWGGLIIGIPLAIAFILHYFRIEKEDDFSTIFENCFYLWLFFLFVLLCFWTIGGMVTLITRLIG